MDPSLNEGCVIKLTINDGSATPKPRTREESEAVMAVNRGRPHRFAFGYSRVDRNGVVLDFRPVVQSLDCSFGTASVAAHVLNTDAIESGTYKLALQDVIGIRNFLMPFVDDPGDHPNIAGLEELASIIEDSDASHARFMPSGYRDIPVLVVQMEADDKGTAGSVGEAFFRLNLVSQREVRPNEFNFDDIFGTLLNLAWTNYGPVQVGDVKRARRELPGFFVLGVDKFPRMVDYEIPSGVRIADADRVRLGAHLAEGTTVMHEGFANFNAGTLGVSMIEGRISQGVVVGDGSDIGGGASTMGRLSGGGKERVFIGKRCLLGANSGLGIPLGDDCVVEAGLYLTAGTKVHLTWTVDEIVAARRLRGCSGILFRRNSETGAVEAIKREGEGIILNAALHRN